MSQSHQDGIPTYRAYEALLYLQRKSHCLPMSIERPCTWPSRSEVRRWLVNRAVQINGTCPGPDDPVTWPIWQLIYFPKSAKRRTTVMDDPEP